MKYDCFRVSTDGQSEDAQVPNSGPRAVSASVTARRVKLGRKPKLTPCRQKQAIMRRDASEPVTEIARSAGVHGSKISRLAA